MAPWASFLSMLRASGMLGQRWHHIGLMLSTFRGILWFVLAFVGPELGPYWAYLGPFWAMLGHLGHVGTILGSCWAILGYFRICVGLCFGLGHFNVVKFSSIPGVCKKHQKYQEQIQFVDCVADGFCCYFSFVFVSFLGHAAVRLCLPDLGLMLGHCGLCRHHIIGSCWAILVYSVVCVCLC